MFGTFNGLMRWSLSATLMDRIYQGTTTTNNKYIFKMNGTTGNMSVCDQTCEALGLDELPVLQGGRNNVKMPPADFGIICAAPPGKNMANGVLNIISSILWLATIYIASRIASYVGGKQETLQYKLGSIHTNRVFVRVTSACNDAAYHLTLPPCVARHGTAHTHVFSPPPRIPRV